MMLTNRKLWSPESPVSPYPALLQLWTSCWLQRGHPQAQRLQQRSGRKVPPRRKVPGQLQASSPVIKCWPFGLVAPTFLSARWKIQTWRNMLRLWIQRYEILEILTFLSIYSNIFRQHFPLVGSYSRISIRLPSQWLIGSRRLSPRPVVLQQQRTSGVVLSPQIPTWESQFTSSMQRLGSGTLSK